MNKLLLLSLLGFALIALSGANEENGENSLMEAESAMEEFETAELADAEAKRRNQRRNKGKKAMRNKKKKGRKSKKGKKKNGRKNKRRNGGKNKKRNGGKKNKKIKTRKNKGKKVQRQARCTLDCLDSGIKIMKIVKDKITNYKRQAIRVAKQAKLGANKGDKKDVFKSSLDDLIDAGGGDKSKLMCAGNATNDGAKQMLNLTETLSNCSDTIKMKCGNESFPTPPEQAEVDACLMNMEKITNGSEACIKKTGAEACSCWSGADFNTAIAAIANCSLSVYAKAVAKAKTACVKSFGNCRKFEDLVGGQIHTCNQDSGKLTAKLGAASANKDALKKVKAATEALVAKLSTKQTNRERRAIATCAAFITASTDLVASITDNPTQDSAAIAAKITELEAFSGDGCSASDLADLNAVVAAADAGIVAVAAVLEKLQAAMVSLTGAPLSDDAVAAAATDAVAGGAATTAAAGGASTSGRMMRRLSLKNVLARSAAKHA